MTFENDKLQQAILLLKDMERECATDIGWLKSMKSKVFKAEETGVTTTLQFKFLSISFYLHCNTFDIYRNINIDLRVVLLT